MKKKMLLPLSAIAAVVVCLGLGVGMGGCGKCRIAPPPPPSTETQKPAIGRDGALIGCLEEQSVVKATLFRADRPGSEKTEVELLPGTWLVPETTFIPPNTSEAD